MKIVRKQMKKIYLILVVLTLFSCKERSKKTSVPIFEVNTVLKRSSVVIDSFKLAQIKDTLVVAFYKANNKTTFWEDDAIRKKLIPLLNNVAEEGLFTKDFDLKMIHDFEKKIDSLSDTELLIYDILLTKNLSKYVQKVSKGKLNPKDLYHNWDLKENTINLQELVLNFQKKDSFESAVKSVRPNHIVYKRLKEALSIINAFPVEDFQKIAINKKIVLNDSNIVLPTIKRKLIYWKDLRVMDSLTPIFDKETELAVKKFQKRHGLAPDGVIGGSTVKALNFSKKRRKEQIIVNLERWRWYPRRLEQEYLIINIPDYRLYVVKNSDTTKTCKIIVGRFKRRTPVLSSKLSYMVLNPTWTVPPTIIEEDVIPAIIKDRNYLAKKNIIAYNANNQVVDTLSWNIEEAKNYNYVQRLGAHNALGLVKFMFQNRFTIYMHDTNAKRSFEKSFRALSSGCIRVQDPLRLTEHLLDDSIKWNLKRINQIVKEGETKIVSFDKDIYIHILYWTAWSEKGSLFFRDDLYNLDGRLYQKLND